MNICIEVETIKEIFYTMSYGNKKFRVEEAKKWLSGRNHKFSSLCTANLGYVKINTIFYEEQILISKFNSEDAKVFLSKMQENQINEISQIQRSRILKKLSAEIKKNSNLIAELALITHGIDTDVTKTVDIPIVSDYIEYYASISYLTTYKHFQWSPHEIVLIIVPDHNTIASIAIAFAPAFAAGCKIILIVESQLVPIGFLFTDICKASGVPDEYLKIVCSADRYGTGQIYLQKDKSISKITYIGDIEGGKTLKYSLGGFPRNLSLMIKSKCSMIVHNDGDIHSACDAIIDGAWKHYGLLPWNLSYVYVQESVYDILIKNLSRKMNSINLEIITRNTSKFAICNNYCSIEKLEQLIKKAEQFGIDYYQPTRDDLNLSGLFLPTIFCGTQIIDNDDFTPVVTILPYRNISEAIALANNTKYGFAVSIWTENESLIKEMSTQLQSSLIWVNCYGLTNPQTSLSPYKESGLGYFGGEEGLLNYMQLDGNILNPYDVYENPGKIDSVKCDEVCAKVAYSKKAFQVWSKYSALEKCKYLQKLADEIENNGKLPTEVKNWWVHILYEYSTKCVLNGATSFINKISCVTIKEPLGVIVIDAIKDMDLIAQLVIFAINNGNAVILVVKESAYLSEIVKLFTSCGFPSNLLTIFRNNDYLKSLVEHEDVQSYWYETSSNDLERFNRSRHIDWRATYNLKKSFIYENHHKFDDITLNMISSQKKAMLGYFGNSITS